MRWSGWCISRASACSWKGSPRRRRADRRHHAGADQGQPDRTGGGDPVCAGAGGAVRLCDFRRLRVRRAWGLCHDDRRHLPASVRRYPCRPRCAGAGGASAAHPPVPGRAHPGVVGLIAGTTLALIKVSLTGLEAVILFALVLAVLFASRAKWVIPAVIAAAALWGWLSLSIRAAA